MRYDNNGLHNNKLKSRNSFFLISFQAPNRRQKFGAELVMDNVKMDPYWQVGECVGAIYKLAHFPFDGSDYDYSGLYVFNVIPSEEYKRICEEPNVDAVGKVCDINVSGVFS